MRNKSDPKCNALQLSHIKTFIKHIKHLSSCRTLETVMTFSIYITDKLVHLHQILMNHTLIIT
uniref:Uncharacterized protein n=1 Tax=Anguilla anguilla TaxID=7936 RepID=A0A0E9W702_ANGAN